MTNLINKADLQAFEGIKNKFKSAQIRAHLAVNRELLIIYWEIGKVILERRNTQKWGSKIIDQLSKYLKAELGTIKGLSATNLKYMAIFAESYSDLLFVRESNEIGQQGVDQTNQGQDNTIGQQTIDQLESHYFINDKLAAILNIPWGHNIDIMTKTQDLTQRIWYARKTIEQGWVRSVLAHQLKSDLYVRQQEGEIKTNNFKQTLPPQDSDLANKIFKGEYNFDFLGSISDRLSEREIEKALTYDVIKFLTELGRGFAFIGKQYHLNVGGDDFYIDLLFFHVELNCYVVIELKNTKFKPEFAGKLNFYLAVVDDLVKKEQHNPTIGIILCQDKNNITARYSLKNLSKPIGIAKYGSKKEEEIIKTIPKEMEKMLPSNKEIMNAIINSKTGGQR